MTDNVKDAAEQRLQAHLAQAEAMRRSTGNSGGLEGMLARISAETTSEAQGRRTDAASKPVTTTGPVVQVAPTLVQLAELAIQELQHPVRRPEAMLLAEQLRQALRR